MRPTVFIIFIDDSARRCAKVIKDCVPARKISTSITCAERLASALAQFEQKSARRRKSLMSSCPIRTGYSRLQAKIKEARRNSAQRRYCSMFGCL